MPRAYVLPISGAEGTADTLAAAVRGCLTSMRKAGPQAMRNAIVPVAACSFAAFRASHAAV